MNQPEQTILTITLTGGLAEWLEEEADRNTRTPSQQAAYLLGNIRAGQERRKQATVERKARRVALGLPTYRQQAAA